MLTAVLHYGPWFLIVVGWALIFSLIRNARELRRCAVTMRDQRETMERQGAILTRMYRHRLLVLANGARPDTHIPQDVIATMPLAILPAVAHYGHGGMAELVGPTRWDDYRGPGVWVVCDDQGATERPRDGGHPILGPSWTQHKAGGWVYEGPGPTVTVPLRLGVQDTAQAPDTTTYEVRGPYEVPVDPQGPLARMAERLNNVDHGSGIAP